MVNNAVRTRWGAMDDVSVARRRHGAITEIVLHRAIFYGAAENDGVPSDGRQPLGGHREASHAKEEAVTWFPLSAEIS